MTRFDKELAWIIKDKYNNRPDKKKLAQDIARLKNSEPVDYIIGYVWFLGCKIDLSRKPLIPRPETEHWTALAIKEINTIPKRVKVLDMFSGSGCVGIAIAKNCKADVDFADISNACAIQIKKNLRINNAKGNIIKTDLFARIKNKYDFILANPPYIPNENIHKIDKSVKDYEPKLALFTTKNGLEHVSRFLSHIHKYLNPKGIFYIEFDSWQAKEVEKIAKRNKHIKIQILKDQYNKIRYARGSRV